MTEQKAENEVIDKGNAKENQVVHTKSVSIKGVLKGNVREIPMADKEIDEADQVTKEIASESKTVEITEEDMQKTWTEYAGLMEKSHPRIYSTLQQHKPVMRELGKIQIILNSNAQRENFVQNIKPGLTRYFQEHLANIEYEFEAKLVESEANGKKVYTDHDKLEYMIRKNEDLDKMKSRFNLDFDN